MNGVDIGNALCLQSAQHKVVFNALMAAWKWKRHVWFGVVNSDVQWKKNLMHYAFVEQIRLSTDGQTCLVDLVTDLEGALEQRFTADIRDIDASTLVVTR